MRQDRLLAVAFAVVMWAVLVFVCTSPRWLRRQCRIAVAGPRHGRPSWRAQHSVDVRVDHRYRLASTRCTSRTSNLALQRARAARRRSAA
ncbi:hypothetical protein HBB16_19475 [Pseudonocardia sp. MCCB 268]|nr:hypothetical protein [Pseudonocardia cytotoxica]